MEEEGEEKVFTDAGIERTFLIGDPVLRPYPFVNVVDREGVCC